MGVGVGFAVRYGASTGGSDFVALMIKRFFPHASLANIILIIDTIIISISGMYTNNKEKMLYCVVGPKEVPTVIKLVKSIDSSAFIVVNDAREVFGEGFKIDTDM